MKMNLSLKLIGAQFVLTLLAILAVCLAVSGGSLRDQNVFWLAALSAAAASLLGWALFYEKLLRRLRHAVEVSQAWLRGDLFVHLEDAVEDELGCLADQVDQLVVLLAHDEQDLSELRQREDRLADQVRALSIAEERARLARELHDGVKQQLFSLAITASAIQDRVQAQPECMPSEMAEMVNQVKTTAQAAQHEMTGLLEGLRPISIQQRGLAATLNEHTLLFGAREHLLIYLEVQGNDDVLPLPVAETLYLVAQEALNNVARHARATRVDMKLICLPEEASLTVRDNGAGFDMSQPHRGMGTVSMQDRLVAIGGRLILRSSPGRGTQVIAQVGLGHPLAPVSEQNRLDPSRPQPNIENWLWLGQRLVIPVAQTWPWLPTDDIYLRRPLLDPSQALHVEVSRGLLGLGKGLVLRAGDVSARAGMTAGGYAWRLHGGRWRYQRISRNGNAVLFRNGQPLAAVQYQGRQIGMWSELIYAGRGYRLAGSGKPGQFQLCDEDGQEMAQLTCNNGLEICIQRPLPLNLLMIAALRLLDEKKAAV